MCIGVIVVIEIGQYNMSREKTYTITMLDSSQLRVVIPKKSNGQDCLDQVRTVVNESPVQNLIVLITGL